MAWLYKVNEALLFVLLMMFILIILGVFTRRVRYFTADSRVGRKLVTEHIITLCKPGKARIAVTEWTSKQEANGDVR